MRTNLLITALLFCITANSQHIIPHSPSTHPKKILPGMFPNHQLHNSGSRSATIPFAIDYTSVDALYAQTMGTDYYYDNELLLNSRYTNNDNSTLNSFVVNFDSLMFIDNGTQLTEWLPLSSAQLHLDSLSIIFQHINNSTNNDTIHIIVFDSDSFHINGSGIGSSLSNNIVWDTLVITNQTIPNSIGDDGSGGFLFGAKMFYPNLNFVQGKSFGVRVEFSGDTTDRFIPIVNFRDDCGNSCVAGPSAAGKHCFYYVNMTISGGTNVSGINSLGYDCNSDGISGTLGQCEEFVIQNAQILPFVTANVQLSVSLPNDTFAFCNGATTLETHVFGQQEPISYQWSPANGLSSITDPNPTVQIPINPILYTVTVTDAASETATASVLVANDQNICGPLDTLSGVVYFDTNNNGIKDSGETALTNTQVESDYGITHQTDSNGRYEFVLTEGTSHHVQVLTYIPSSWLTQPTNATHDYTYPAGNNHTNLNFGVHTSPDSNNVRVFLDDDFFPPRPGFNSYYLVTCQNTLLGYYNGTVQLIYDTNQVYVSSFPSPSVVNMSTHTLQWTVVNLGGGYNANFHITLQTPQTVPLGTHFTEIAQVTPDAGFLDYDSFDNEYTLTEIVVGSFDPNDKSVSPVGSGVAHSVLPAQDLNYTIRFQNTGTFLAQNVSVADTIDSDLDMATFKMVSASHTYTYTKQGNVIIWHFNNIMLPDSGSDQAGSHGYIHYAIKPRANVSDMAVIENTAYIYFDFNAPVVTNTTSNMIDFNLGITNVASSELGVRVYPNPFSNETNIVVNSDERNLTFQVFDITGRKVDETRNISVPVYKYHSEKLSKGVYNFVLRNDTGIRARGKLFVQ